MMPGGERVEDPHVEVEEAAQDLRREERQREVAEDDRRDAGEQLEDRLDRLADARARVLAQVDRRRRARAGPPRAARSGWWRACRPRAAARRSSAARTAASTSSRRGTRRTPDLAEEDDRLLEQREDDPGGREQRDQRRQQEEALDHGPPRNGDGPPGGSVPPGGRLLPQLCWLLPLAARRCLRLVGLLLAHRDDLRRLGDGLVVLDDVVHERLDLGPLQGLRARIHEQRPGERRVLAVLDRLGGRLDAAVAAVDLRPGSACPCSARSRRSRSSRGRPPRPRRPGRARCRPRRAGSPRARRPPHR